MLGCSDLHAVLQVRADVLVCLEVSDGRHVPDLYLRDPGPIVGKHTEQGFPITGCQGSEASVDESLRRWWCYGELPASLPYARTRAMRRALYRHYMHRPLR